MTETEACFSCGAVVPVIEGPTHDYMLSSPGCWSVFSEVLGREYGDPAYMRNHRLTVDAYAVQHPGEECPPAVQSVAFHLISLCLVFEHGAGQAEATRTIMSLADSDRTYSWLDPPPSLGEVTVAAVHRTGDPEAHAAAVDRWARSTWNAWSRHHPTVERWVDELP